MINDKLIWTPTSDGGQYMQHRIPGIVVTKRDTVIVYCEARKPLRGNYPAGGDWNTMDIYIQRSEDHGESFGDPIYLARGEGDTLCVNNPVMIVGNDNTLHILYCKNYSINGGGLWYRRSTDDGLTWSAEREVTKFASAVADFDCFAFGPTHGICTSKGVLMTPVWYVPERAGKDITAHGPSKVAVFYSTDNGETWNLSVPASKNTNETDIAELSDGSIMLNSRIAPYRAVSVSQNGIDGWSETLYERALPDPGCCAGMVTADVKGLPRGLLFVNCANSSAREYVTVKCSFDDGKTYPKWTAITGEGVGGYSDIAVDSAGRVFVLYEENWGAKVHLATFSYSDAFCK
ncbi:MAG: exo-alpha-sialidase [Clostridia bacterium]|nr:exo-alpha-sialidase [Clostridia bacterium]